jgi:hypothetical protein
MIVLIKQRATSKEVKEWVVWDTDAKKRLYGPKPRHLCEEWRNDRQRKVLPRIDR